MPNPTTDAETLQRAREAAVPILYRNWRGETTVRRISLHAIAYGNEATGLAFGWNEWHPEEQWLLSAYDIEKGAWRSFAMAGILAWGEEAVSIALDRAAQSAARETAAPVDGGEVLRVAREVAADYYAWLRAGTAFVESIRSGRSDADREVKAGVRVLTTFLSSQHTKTPALRADAPDGVSERRAFADDMRSWGENCPDPDYFEGECLSVLLMNCGQAGALIHALLDEIADHPAQTPIPETPALGERWADDPLVAYLERQWSWSRQTFGPALRTRGIIQHITKELREIELEPYDLSEWVDVVILAMDGFWRHGGKPENLLPAMQAKQDRNFARAWPDWRTMSEDQAIEHDRSGEAAPAPDQTPPRGGVTVEEIANIIVEPGEEVEPLTLRQALAVAFQHTGWSEPHRTADAALAQILNTLSRQSAGAGTETQRIDAWAYGWIDRETPKAFGRETYRDGYANGALDVAVKLRGLIREIDPDIDTRLAAAPPETPPAGSPQCETGGPA